MNVAPTTLPSGSSLARLIIESATDVAIITTDRSGIITSWNPGAETIMAWTADEIIGRDIAEIFTPEDREQPERERTTALTTGRAENKRWHRRKDGSRFWGSGMVMPLRDETIEGFVKILRDDTQQRIIEAELRASEAFSRRILASSADCIKVLGLDGHLEFMSEGALCVMEVDDFGAIQGMCWPELWVGDEQAKAIAAMDAARRGGTGRFQGFASTLKGSPRWWDVIVTPIPGPDGAPAKLLSVSRDITGSKQVEARLERRSQQLQELARAALAVAQAPTLEATLEAMTQAARRIIGAHQGVVSLTQGTDWSQSINAVTLTDKYAPWRQYAAATDGSGIYAWAIEENRPVRMTQAELEAHPRWRGFGMHAAQHPPMRGWLAAPLVGRDGRNLGLIQLSDKEDGSDFDAADEAMLVQLAQLASASVEQSLAERKIAEREAHLNAIFEQSAAGFSEVDATGRFLRVNNRFCEIVGRTREELLDLRMQDITHPDDLPRNIPLFEQSTGSGRRFDIEKRYLRPDGAVVWVHNSVTTLRDRNGQLLTTVCTTVDRTERKRSEAALRESESRLRRVLDQLFAFVGVTTPDGTLIEVNRAPLETAGIAAADVVGKPFWEAYWWSYDPSVQARLKEAVMQAATGAVVRYDVPVRMAGSELLTIDFQIAPLRDNEGRITHLIPSATIIEERLRAERQLKALNATLEQRVAERTSELERAHDQLRQAQKMEAIGQLTGGIAHDFNNLLTGIIGSLDMMQRRIAQGQMHSIARYATAAVTAANRAAALTHRLLAFSRRQPLDPKPVNANRLVTGMEELLRRTIGETIKLEIVTAGGLWQTLCDPHQLESAVLNLAINARDAMPEGGTLTIETCNAHLDPSYAARQREVKPGQYVCICVSDTGTGMRPDVLAKAFDPFFTTKPIGQGTGLGLSMIYGFARQSEGYARIYSEVDQGTTVKLYLPRYYGTARADEESRAGLGDEHITGHGETVLVVEDESAVRALVVDVLEELGYRAVEASDGPAGLALLQSSARIDLLITDIGLPGINGRKLADAARQLRPELKVLFITGYAENAAIASGFLAPGMQMITKPFAIETLATRIRDIIEGRR